MADFKKDSLLENYNRILGAKNRVDEAGMFYGSGFAKNQPTTSEDVMNNIEESINDARIILMQAAREYGADRVLDYVLENMDIQDRAKIAYDVYKNSKNIFGK